MQIFKTTLLVLLIYPGWYMHLAAQQQNLPSPVIDSITVINGKVHIFWQPLEDPAIFYPIYRWNGGWPTIDTVFTDPYQYTDNTGYDPASQDSLYAVEARNDVNFSVWTENMVKPPFLKPIQIQPCNTRVTLEWTPYKPDFRRNVVKYQIIARINSEEFVVLVDDISPGDSAYTDLPVQPGLPYSFAIRAFDSHEPSPYSSTSCIQSLPTNIPQVTLPDNLTIIRAGTSKTESSFDNRNTISWEIDPAPDPPVKEFIVWRSIDGVNYENIATVEGSVFSFSDIESDPTKTSYYYKVEAIDQCDFSLIQSDACKTIHLDGKADYNECRLDWTKFIGPVTPVDYFIYMILDGDFSNPIFQPPAIKDTFSIVGISGFQNIREFGFYIQTRTTTGNPSDISRSNYITLSPETNLILPSAFDPGSSLEENRIFKPRYRFRPENTNYYMGVFNKWGEQIFESKEVEKGWDGNLPDGSAAPSDVYAYIVRYQSKIGLIKELKGTVTLVR